MDQVLGDDQTIWDPHRTLLCEVGPHFPDDSCPAFRRRLQLR